MKLHRWYSAFRNLGFWAICVFAALFVVNWFYPSVHQIPVPVHRIQFVLSGIALAVLPVVFIIGLIFPYRSEREISRRQTFFGWVVGALFGTFVVFATLSTFEYEMDCPYIPDEQLFAFVQESLNRVPDSDALETEIGRLAEEKSSHSIDVWGNDATFTRTYPSLAAFLRHLHRRGIRVSASCENHLVLGPMIIVRLGNHSNYAWICLHQRWNRPSNFGENAREITPAVVFSPDLGDFY